MTLKMVKITFSEGQFLTKNFDFRGHISTFRAENTPKNEPFKVEDNAETNNSKANPKKPRKQLV